PARADIDPRRPDIFERFQPVTHRAGGDHPLVIFGAGIDIVVVIVEPRLSQLARLVRRQHAQRHAGFEAHFAHALHDLDDPGHVAILGIAPGGTHTEALAAGIL